MHGLRLQVRHQPPGHLHGLLRRTAAQQPTNLVTAVAPGPRPASAAAPACSATQFQRPVTGGGLSLSLICLKWSMSTSTRELRCRRRRTAARGAPAPRSAGGWHNLREHVDVGQHAQPLARLAQFALGALAAQRQHDEGYGQRRQATTHTCSPRVSCGRGKVLLAGAGSSATSSHSAQPARAGAFGPRRRRPDHRRRIQQGDAGSHQRRHVVCPFVQCMPGAIFRGRQHDHQAQVDAGIAGRPVRASSMTRAQQHEQRPGQHQQQLQQRPGAGGVGRPGDRRRRRAFSQIAQVHRWKPRYVRRDQVVAGQRARRHQRAGAAASATAHPCVKLCDPAGVLPPGNRLIGCFAGHGASMAYAARA